MILHGLGVISIYTVVPVQILYAAQTKIELYWKDERMGGGDFE